MQVIDLAAYAGEDRIISSIEMRQSFKKKDHQLTIKGKIPSLDSFLDGFVPGELIAISGITKNGKTLFSQTLTKNFYESQVFSLWFTYELPARQFLSCFPDMPLLYLPKTLKTANMDWVEERIRESFLKYATRVVFIDHLHYLFDMARARNVSLEIGTVVRRLKTIAVKNELIIFLMCHTTKPGKDVDNMGFEGIRDSSVVAQESDVVLMVQRKPELGSDVARLGIEFSRRTGVMKQEVWLQKIGGYLRETTKRDEAEPQKKKNYFD
ncbi:MAG: hypothetical protein M0P57_15010 [Syntrophales bacterium]|jgi:replicative DNA helicase|nr:hypothetical protein [Syntrophales bacterium]MDY0044417.1 DnaB-like helicase C-terminal domain-containing protein [Syntrophales bacterium]